MALMYNEQNVILSAGASTTTGFTISGYERFSISVPTFATYLNTAVAAVRMGVYSSDSSTWTTLLDGTNLQNTIVPSLTGNWAVVKGPLPFDTVRLEMDGTNSTATAAMSFKVRGQAY